MEGGRRTAAEKKATSIKSVRSAITLDKKEQIHAALDSIIQRIGSIKESHSSIVLNFEELRELCLRCRILFLKEETLLELKPPLIIFGDLHGQLLDLKRMIQACEPPPKTRYLFLGDYVDRGEFSVETISLLLAYKLRYPQSVFLLRGNHETRVINYQYGFMNECKRKYEKGVELWSLFQHVFNCLPVAALISRRIFCAHGGISQNLRHFNQLKVIERPTDVCDMGLLADLIWSDPSKATEFFADSPRQISQVFGRQACKEFCARFDLDLICRAHQCVKDGYEFFAGRLCLTIFSAPYYCGQTDNVAGMLTVDQDLKCQILTFDPTGRNVRSCPTQGSERKSVVLMKVSKEQAKNLKDIDKKRSSVERKSFVERNSNRKSPNLKKSLENMDRRMS